MIREVIKILRRINKLLFALFTNPYQRSMKMSKTMFLMRSKYGVNLKNSNRIKKTNVNINSIACFLGPYRNLTTLTASNLALHPNCQVLNHGWEMILKDPTYNIFYNPTKEKLDRFVRLGIHLSIYGDKKIRGGQITNSHAFSRSEDIRTAYHLRFGNELLKPNASCLIWKESQRILNFIDWFNVDFNDLFDHYSELRFIVPIRNPIHVALSNMKTGQYLKLVNSKDYNQIVSIILGNYLRLFNLQNLFPDKFFIFFAFDDPKYLSGKLESFLNIPHDQQWVSEFPQHFKIIEPNYRLSQTQISTYVNYCQKYFSKHEPILSKFNYFINENGNDIVNHS